jgi:hypothetical protein
MLSDVPGDVYQYSITVCDPEYTIPFPEVWMHYCKIPDKGVTDFARLKIVSPELLI